MASYTRQKAAEIVLGAVARASDLAAEFDQLQAAFNSSTGHTHSGTSGEGAPITVVGPAQDIIVSGTTARPKTDNTMDLGSATYEYKDGYFDGTLYTDAINLDGTAITATAAEINVLDGITATVAELNILDGVTATAAELNKLAGMTASTAELNKLDGMTASTVELNKLAGMTASTAELNKLNGVTASTAELNYTDGVTSAIQTQIDGKTAPSDIPVLVAGIAAGAVGSLIFANCGGGVQVDYGDTVAGSTLTPAGFSQSPGASERADIDIQLSVQSGSWRALGYTPGTGGGATNATLFIRIS